MGFPPTAHSLNATATVTRPFEAFDLFSCFVLVNVYHMAGWVVKDFFGMYLIPTIQSNDI